MFVFIELGHKTIEIGRANKKAETQD